MTQQQYVETVELEQAWREEIEAKKIERANEILAEMRANSDDDYAEQLAERFPQLRAWPGRKATK